MAASPSTPQAGEAPAPDLAALVLAARPQPSALRALPRHAPVVAIALLVAIVVAGVGWATWDAIRPVPARQAAAGGAADAGANASAASAASVVDAFGAAGEPTVAASPGVDLAASGITLRRDGGAWRARVVVSNGGATAVTPGRPAEVMLLVDGEPVGTSSVERLPADGARRVVEFELQCAAGRHQLVAVADPAARFAEGDEASNATTLEATLDC